MEIKLRTCMFVLCVWLCLTGYIKASDECTPGDPLSKGEMREILLGRCQEYQAYVNPTFPCIDGERNCTAMTDTFMMSLENPDCDAPSTIFNPFIELGNYSVEDKQMFWSGVYGFVQSFSADGKRFTVLEDTLIGYMINGLNFCLSDGNNEGNTPADTCPGCGFTSTAFWTAASVNFAQNARGDIYLMLNGSKDPIVRSNSYFMNHELPNLREGSVKKTTIYILNPTPSKKGDLCETEASIQNIKSELAEKNILFYCEENPRAVLYLYCIDHGSTEVCENLAVNAAATFNMFLASLLTLAAVVITRVTVGAWHSVR